jgi:hypothetical protein
VGAAACGLLLSYLALAACSAEPSALCRNAAAMAQKHDLRGAAKTYADAQRRKAGSCASDGLAEVAKLQAQAAEDVAQGAAAESAADLSAARAAYQSALAIDAGNADARAGLARVNQRPSTLSAVWLAAQRLHDEGMTTRRAPRSSECLPRILS